MSDRLTLSSAEKSRLMPNAQNNDNLTLIPHDTLRSSMATALEAVTSASNSYSLNTLAERQEVLDQRRRSMLLLELESEDDFLADDATIEIELIAGAHLQELHSVLDDLGGGKLVMSQDIIDDMVGLMSELRNIMPELPGHLINEIKDVARPLRVAVTEFQNRVEVI